MAQQILNVVSQVDTTVEGGKRGNLNNLETLTLIKELPGYRTSNRYS